ncbi:unnamed protein product [Pieris brassicae]|uniref:Uncharacterized protein n=1 Tax=Pieris brassicae TaxID=7116 RepID=A0A9P0X7Z7_PIEBR|nr:unnamed protein product [Pieris brassicae]
MIKDTASSAKIFKEDYLSGDRNISPGSESGVPPGLPGIAWDHPGLADFSRVAVAAIPALFPSPGMRFKLRLSEIYGGNDFIQQHTLETNNLERLGNSQLCKRTDDSC